MGVQRPARLLPRRLSRVVQLACETELTAPPAVEEGKRGGRSYHCMLR